MLSRLTQILVLLIAVLAYPALPGTISGRVVEDHSGSALASAEIQVLRAGSSELVADLESDTDGRFELSDLPAGEYRIEVSKPNYISTTLPVRLTDEIPPLTFVARLIRCGVVSGQVLDANGQPMGGATVFAMIKPDGGGPWRRFAPHQRGHQAGVDENGAYRLFDLPPGRYVVAVTYGASTVTVGSAGSAQVGAAGSGVLYYPANARPRVFTVSGGEEYRDVDFFIAAGMLFRVSGKVDPAPSQPGFWLALTSVDQPAFATAVAQADADGSFHFQGIPPASYTLFAFGPAHARGPNGAIPDEHARFGRMPVEVSGNLDGLSIPVEQARSASFVLRNAVEGDHSCPSSMKLSLSSLDDWAADLDRTVQVDFAKPVRVDGLAPGRYLLTVRDSGENCGAHEQVLDLRAPNNPGPISIAVGPKK